MFIRRSAAVPMLVLALILSACGASAAPPTAAPAPAPTAAPAATSISAEPTAAPAAVPTSAGAGITITDSAGRAVTLAATPERLVSLAPSTTEILFALGLGPKLLAADEFSDYPAEAKDLPKVGGSNAAYNFEQIVALKPDLVFTAGITPPEVIAKLEQLKLSVLVLGKDKATFDSIFADITLAGQATGQAAQAEQVTTAMKAKLESIKSKAATVTKKPLVYWELDATDPAKPYSIGAGNFVSDMVALVGGVNVFDKTDSPYPQVSSEQVVAANPDVIILSDAAYGITADSVAQRPGWQAITAVEQRRIEPIDDNLVSRPGPRIVDGLEAAAKIIHPELFK
jgi:iron complex transport system substrate-binding protein